jgi:hypothetical protein
MTDSELLAHIESLGDYREVRLLPDGSIIAIGDLMFTRAIYMDVSPDGWGRRFCFQDQFLADAEFHRLESEDQEPVGWIARR